MAKSGKKKKNTGGFDKEGVRVISRNKRVGYEYEILDTLECGIVLRGTEVKALRASHVSIVEAYGMFRGSELFLVGANISEYRHGNVHNHAPERERKLLAHRRQLNDWRKRVREKGITIKVLEIRFVGERVKVEMALGRGKKLYDKRQAARERDDRRDLRRQTSLRDRR